MRKRFVFMTVFVSLCALWMMGCSQVDTHDTKPSPSLAAYEGYTEKELIHMMCECDCNTLQGLVYSGNVDSVSDVVGLGEHCAVIKEFFSRPHSMVVFREYALEVYNECAQSEDHDLRMNAMGFGMVIDILCPDLTSGSN